MLCCLSCNLGTRLCGCIDADISSKISIKAAIEDTNKDTDTKDYDSENYDAEDYDADTVYEYGGGDYYDEDYYEDDDDGGDDDDMVFDWACTAGSDLHPDVVFQRLQSATSK